MRSGFGITHVHGITHVFQHRTQRRQAQHDVVRTAGVTHQAKTPDLAGERSEAGADFQAELGEQHLAHFGLVDAFGTQHCVHLRRLVRFFDQELEPHRFESGFERGVMTIDTRPRILQAFFADQQQRFVQRKQRVGRRGVVIGAGGFAPVAEQQIHVHEPGMNLVLA